MKNTKTYIFLIIAAASFALQNGLYSQPSVVWSALYNGPANQQDSGVGSCLSPNGQMFFVTGWSLGTGTLSDIVTIRYNPATGDTMWVNRYSNPANQDDKVYAITCDNNAVYITGFSFNPGRDIITIKYDAATGNRLWVKFYNGTIGGGDYGFAIDVDNSGNVFVTGRSDIGGAQKFTTLGYDASGNVLAGWPNVYTGPLSTTSDEAHAIRVDNSGNVYVTGRAGTPGDILTLKINSAGVTQWAKLHNGSGNGEDNSVAMVLNSTFSDVYVGGYTSRTASAQDFIVIRYSASTGDSTAGAIYTGPSGFAPDVLTSMTIDPGNNVYVTGASTDIPSSLDYATLKYDPNLNQLWLRRTTNTAIDIPRSIAVDNASGNVYVTGSSQSGSPAQYDYLTISYRNDGNFNWEKREMGSANSNDYPSSVAVADTEKIFISGSANFNGIGIAFYTLRYSKISGIEPISGEVPTSFALNQNYPNPFNPSITIRFDIPKSELVKLVVYDIMGKEVSVLANENVSAGKYEVKWNAASYSSGIYFYTLTAGDFRETKKMILTK